MRVNVPWDDWQKYLQQRHYPASFHLFSHKKPFEEGEAISTGDLRDAVYFKESDFEASAEGFPEFKAEIVLNGSGQTLDSSYFSMIYARSTSAVWHEVFRNCRLNELGNLWSAVEERAKKTLADPRVNRVGLYQITPPFGKPNGYLILHTWILPRLPAYFDAHMHIQSSRSAPLPLVWDKIPVSIKPSWDTMESWPMANIAGSNFVKIGMLPTDKVGDAAINDLKMAISPYALGPLADIYQWEADRVITPLMMDMEYGHVRGYEGVPIYENDSEGNVFFCPDPTNLKIREKVNKIDALKLESFDTQIVRTKNAALNHSWKLLPYLHYDPRRWKYGQRTATDFRSQFCSSIFYKNAKPSQAWKSWSQSADLKSQLALAPMRWVVGESTPGGELNIPFIGVKMYSSLGYRPDDFHRLPNLYELYGYCQKEGIPIMNHCTDEGMYTHQRLHYYRFLRNDPGFKKNAALETLIEQGKQLENQLTSLNNAMGIEGISTAIGINQNATEKASTEWFKRHFIHPSAWEDVAKKFPSLRVCLAHFADAQHFSPKAGGFKVNGASIDPTSNDWAKSLIDLIQPGNQIHADLSYVIFNEKNWKGFEVFFKWAREHRPWIFDRIMWGSDWFMIGVSNEVEMPMLANYNRHNLKFLLRLDFGAELWMRFTLLNPLRFLNLKNRAVNLEKAIGSQAPKWIRETPEKWEDFIVSQRKWKP